MRKYEFNKDVFFSEHLFREKSGLSKSKTNKILEDNPHIFTLCLEKVEWEYINNHFNYLRLLCRETWLKLVTTLTHSLNT